MATLLFSSIFLDKIYSSEVLGGKKNTGKTGTTHSGLGCESLLFGFLGAKTKPEAGGAKWSLLIFPFMDMQ